MKSSEKHSDAQRQILRVKDIIGFAVFDEFGNKLGVLSEVINTASNDVWIVKYGGREMPVPALKSVVRQIDASAQKIIVRLPEGFEEICGDMKKNAEDIEYDGYCVYED
jgi:hypothetical protein